MSKPNEFKFNLDDLAVIALPATELAWLAGVTAIAMANADIAAVDKSLQETKKTLTDKIDKEALRTAEGWMNYSNDMCRLSAFFLVIHKIYGGYPYIKK